MAQEEGRVADGGEPDAEAMTYVFADLFWDALREARSPRQAVEGLREAAAVADGYAAKYAGVLNLLECRMAVRSLLKGKTIRNVFPVEGYRGERG
jgi:hypothetical protein